MTNHKKRILLKIADFSTTLAVGFTSSLTVLRFLHGCSLTEKIVLPIVTGVAFVAGVVTKVKVRTAEEDLEM